MPALGASGDIPGWRRDWVDMKFRYLVLLAIFALSVFPVAAQEGFRAKGGDWAIQPLVISAQPGKQSLMFGGDLLWRSPDAQYFFSVGAGVPALDIPDAPTAAAWKLVAEEVCARLESIPLESLKTMASPLKVDQWNLPYGCGEGFEDHCASRDGRVKVDIVFSGKTKVRKRHGGWFGSEGLMDFSFYTGVRTLTLTDTAKGRQARFEARLHDETGYTVRHIRYLPEPGLVLLLSDGDARSLPYCLKL